MSKVGLLLVVSVYAICCMHQGNGLRSRRAPPEPPGPPDPGPAKPPGPGGPAPAKPASHEHPAKPVKPASHEHPTSAEKPTPKPPPPPKYKVVAVPVDGLYNKDHTGFFPDLLDLIRTRTTVIDIEKDVKWAESFDDAVDSLAKDRQIFAGAVERDGTYANRINFTVPIFGMHIVSAYNSKLSYIEQNKVEVTTLNYTNMPNTIKDDPHAGHKLPPGPKEQAQKGKAGSVMDIDQGLQAVQDGKSVFIGRTPVLDNKLGLGTKFPDVRVECQKQVYSSFGITNDALLMKALNAAIEELQRDGSLELLYIRHFPASTYFNPEKLDSESGGSESGKHSGMSGNQGNGNGLGNLLGNGLGNLLGSELDQCSKFSGHKQTSTKSIEGLIQMLSKANLKTLQEVSRMVDNKLSPGGQQGPQIPQGVVF